MTPFSSIQTAVKSIFEEIERVNLSSPVSKPPTRLIAASKSQSNEAILEAILAGVTDFGENKIQEALLKWPTLKASHPHVQLHLIGPLQTNKVKEAIFFDTIQTVDRPKLADALAKEMDKSGVRPACLIQINTGKEPQKAGVLPEETDAFIHYCREILRLPIEGLMCIPPVNAHPAPHFALLSVIAKRNELNRLSMGMSEDFKEAILLGATEVRVGRAIFGERLA